MLIYPIKIHTKAYSVDGSNYILLYTSNAFKDKEHETFATKALQKYVDRRDQNHLKDRAWFWHVPGTDFGTVVWQGLVGRMLMELVKMDDTKIGRKMLTAFRHPEKFPDVLPQGWGTSHGYVYLANHKTKDKTYTNFEKFETTLLPFHRASNPYGKLKEVYMTVTQEKIKAFAALVGEDNAKEALAGALAESDQLEQHVDFKELTLEEVYQHMADADIDFKASTSDDDEDEDMEYEKEDDDEDEDEEGEFKPGSPEFMKMLRKKKRRKTASKRKGTKAVDMQEEVMEIELDDDLLNDIASRVDIQTAVKEAVSNVPDAIMDAVQTAVKEHMGSTTFLASMTAAIAPVIESLITSSKEQVVQNALTGKIVLKPWSATKDNGGTTLTQEQVDAINGAKENATHTDPVSALVSNMLSGRG